MKFYAHTSHGTTAQFYALDHENYYLIIACIYSSASSSTQELLCLSLSKVLPLQIKKIGSPSKLCLTFEAGLYFNWNLKREPPGFHYPMVIAENDQLRKWGLIIKSICM